MLARLALVHAADVMSSSPGTGTSSTRIGLVKLEKPIAETAECVEARLLEPVELPHE